MNYVLKWFLVIAVFVSLPQSVDAAESDVPLACRRSIDARFPGWTLSPPPAAYADYAKQRKLTTNIAQADFDSDGTRDTAVLIIAPGAGGSSPYIVVCLAKKTGINTVVIRDPYCRDGIGVTPKGTKAYDFEAEKDITYRTNGVAAVCFEQAGATYIFENGDFKRVIDSD